MGLYRLIIVIFSVLARNKWASGASIQTFKACLRVLLVLGSVCRDLPAASSQCCGDSGLFRFGGQCVELFLLLGGGINDSCFSWIHIFCLLILLPCCAKASSFQSTFCDSCRAAWMLLSLQDTCTVCFSRTGNECFQFNLDLTCLPDYCFSC